MIVISKMIVKFVKQKYTNRIVKINKSNIQLNSTYI
jgi:hypothetical protein